MHYSTQATVGGESKTMGVPVHDDSGPARELRSGKRGAMRPAKPSDREKLREMFSRCASKTIYRRFYIPYGEVPERMLVLMLDVDRNDRVFLVAASHTGEILGHAMYVGLGGGSEAEMAIIVEDAWWSRGVGRSLVFGLARRARLRGIETFTAEVLGGNRRMLGLAATFAGAEYRIRHSLYHVRMPLLATGPAAENAQTLPPAA